MSRRDGASPPGEGTVARCRSSQSSVELPRKLTSPENTMLSFFALVGTGMFVRPRVPLPFVEPSESTPPTGLPFLSSHWPVRAPETPDPSRVVFFVFP